MKKWLYSIIFSISLISFTVYVVLDTFVLTQEYQVVEEEKTTEAPKDETIIQTEDYYKDSNIEIKLDRIRELDTEIYLVDVKLSDVKYLKTAFAKNTFGKNVSQVTSKIAADHNAILAINGDFYGVQEKGYVLRNYKIYRKSAKSNQSDLVIKSDGSFEIIEEKEIKLTDVKDAKEVLSFGPALVVDGKVNVDKNDEVAKARASNPRTAIAIIDDLHYLFLVSDGRTKESKGLSLYELANFLTDYDVKIAYNLDGGGSSTLYFNGEVINNPTHDGKKMEERKVSDIVYIGY